MLTRRSLFVLPAGLAAVAGAAAVQAAPAMSHDEAFAHIKSLIDAALTPHGPPFPKWGEVEGVVKLWLHFYKSDWSAFNPRDDFIRQKVQGFFSNRRMSDLIKQGKFINERGRIAHSAQILLIETFPLELDQFDATFTVALLALSPKG